MNFVFLSLLGIPLLTHLTWPLKSFAGEPDAPRLIATVMTPVPSISKVEIDGAWYLEIISQYSAEVAIDVIAVDPDSEENISHTSHLHPQVVVLGRQEFRPPNFSDRLDKTGGIRVLVPYQNREWAERVANAFFQIGGLPQRKVGLALRGEIAWTDFEKPGPLLINGWGNKVPSLIVSQGENPPDEESYRLRWASQYPTILLKGDSNLVVPVIEAVQISYVGELEGNEDQVHSRWLGQDSKESQEHENPLTDAATTQRMAQWSQLGIHESAIEDSLEGRPTVSRYITHARLELPSLSWHSFDWDLRFEHDPELIVGSPQGALLSLDWIEVDKESGQLLTKGSSQLDVLPGAPWLQNGLARKVSALRTHDLLIYLPNALNHQRPKPEPIVHPFIQDILTPALFGRPTPGRSVLIEGPIEKTNVSTLAASSPISPRLLPATNSTHSMPFIRFRPDGWRIQMRDGGNVRSCASFLSR